jgi:hypothetical protein
VHLSGACLNIPEAGRYLWQLPWCQVWIGEVKGVVHPPRKCGRLKAHTAAGPAQSCSSKRLVWWSQDPWRVVGGGWHAQHTGSVFVC